MGAHAHDGSGAIAEEAGGKALDDGVRIMDKQPQSLHERSPFYIGNRHLVEALEACRWARGGGQGRNTPSKGLTPAPIP